MDNITYIIINNRFATYYELKYKYDSDEFLDLYDASVTTLANKYISIKDRKNGGNKK